MATRNGLAEEIRQRISDGDFAPGARLSEGDLAAQFSVSRNTLREAFRVLEAAGLIEHVPNRGVSVSSPSVADVVDLYRARRTLECGAMMNASPRHPNVAVMRAAVEAGEAASAADNWKEVGSANQAFHNAIVGLADSPRLNQSFRNTSAELRLAFLEIDDLRAVHEPFVGRNGEILDCLIAEGPQAAAIALERYLTDAERVILGAFSRMGRG